MDRLSSIVKSRFGKHWRTISCQIRAVNDDSNPKRGFLFDCGALDVDKLIDLVRDLKNECLIAREVTVAVVKEDSFILNTQKFLSDSSGSCPIVIDVSGCLKLPEKIISGSVAMMLDEIRGQLINNIEADVTLFKVNDDWCVPTIFGYLIGYPVLYCLRPGQDNNNLSFVELLVFQVLMQTEVLISFSIPKAIHDQDTQARDSIEHFLSHFQKSTDFEVKSFAATHSVVIL